MKIMKLLAASAIILSFATACSRHSAGYTLTATLDGLPDGTRVQLLPVGTGSQQVLADTVVADGKFVFSGVADEPRAVLLMVKDAYGSCPLMLENGEMKLEGKITSHPSGGGQAAYSFAEVKVSGSPLTDKYVRLLGVREALDSVYQADNERFKDIRHAYRRARLAQDQALMDSILATDAYRASARADSLFFANVEAAYYKVVMDHKDSYWGPLMMVSLFSYLTEEQKPWYDALSPEAKQSYYGQMVKADVAPDSKVGTEVPAFTAKSQDGKPVTLAELCKDKRYILIDFWASWCNPCRKEIPNLKRLHAQYADQGFQIVSLSIDKKASDWEKALEEEQLPWPNFLDTEGIADAYQVKFVPTMYLIDAQGIVQGENLRGEELASKLAELFGGKE